MSIVEKSYIKKKFEAEKSFFCKYRVGKYCHLKNTISERKQRCQRQREKERCVSQSIVFIEHSLCGEDTEVIIHSVLVQELAN